ncbi:MAG: hypothetical protein D6728_18920 [Cyanobacteria bacterium J055]|nr:MAG: hypothetical protein D6728_18920 [Cyanobacteria bacterium J055]
MKSNSLTFTRKINRFAIGLILFEIAIVVIYLGSIFATGTPDPPFDMNGKMTVPSLLQSSHLLAIGLISLFLFLKLPRDRGRPSHRFMLSTAILLIYGAINEVFKIHLHLADFLPIEKRSWMVIYAIVFFGLPTVFYRDLLFLWRHHRRETSFALLGMVIFAVGGFLGELLRDFLIFPVTYKIFSVRDIIAIYENIDLVESFRIAFEEFFELSGETFVLYGFMLFAANKIASPE